MWRFIKNRSRKERHITNDSDLKERQQETVKKIEKEFYYEEKLGDCLRNKIAQQKINTQSDDNRRLQRLAVMKEHCNKIRDYRWKSCQDWEGKNKRMYNELSRKEYIKMIEKERMNKKMEEIEQKRLREEQKKREEIEQKRLREEQKKREEIEQKRLREKEDERELKNLRIRRLEEEKRLKEEDERELKNLRIRRLEEERRLKEENDKQKYRFTYIDRNEMIEESIRIRKVGGLRRHLCGNQADQNRPNHLFRYSGSNIKKSLSKQFDGEM